jgi:hypothetical protein
MVDDASPVAESREMQPQPNSNPSKNVSEEPRAKIFTVTEVGKHDRAEDCWIIYGEEGEKKVAWADYDDFRVFLPSFVPPPLPPAFTFLRFNKVYDVSKFLDEHPGGDQIMLDVAGKDVTSEFEVLRLHC